MANTRAAAVYQHLGLPVPTGDRVAKVYVRAKDLQPEILESYADKLAAFVVTAAMAHGVTKIELHFPNRDLVTLDTDDIVAASAAELGYWPAVTVPAQVSVMNLARLGARFEPWRPIVAVPAQVGSTGVSGDEPAPKEV